MAEALRANTILKRLDFREPSFFRDMRAAEIVMRALVGHPSVTHLFFGGGAAALSAADLTILGAAMGALVAADATALCCLAFQRVMLNEDCLVPLVNALPRNRHLRQLSLPQADLSEAFVREQLLPAVSANTALRHLDAGPAARDAELLVRERPPING